ncbi:MAG: TatD family hydrolase [Candidatus Sericytochromatia bacterium]|nr:TatD family hydrolase [Candidatus Tanganyikabacteria bacterium]
MPLRGVVDSHCHLDQLPGWRAEVRPEPEAALSEIAEILDRAAEAGVVQTVVPGCAWPDFGPVAIIAERFPAVWAAFGIHPHDAATWDSDGPQRLARALAGPRTQAVGEIGLDYHYNFSLPEAQREAFRAQIRVARDIGKPLIVHTREAEADTLEIMRAEGAGEVGGVMHCFTGTRDLALACVDLGFHVSFSGVLCFPKSADLREVARAIPLERTLVETDAPYLAPPPHRGRRNEPAYVVAVIEALAGIHGRPAEEVAEITARNARVLFGLPTP